MTGNRWYNNGRTALVGTARYAGHVAKEIFDYFRYSFPAGNIIEGPSLTDFLNQARNKVKLKVGEQ